MQGPGMQQSWLLGTQRQQPHQRALAKDMMSSRLHMEEGSYSRASLTSLVHPHQSGSPVSTPWCILTSPGHQSHLPGASPPARVTPDPWAPAASHQGRLLHRD